MILCTVGVFNSLCAGWRGGIVAKEVVVTIQTLKLCKYGFADGTHDRTRSVNNLNCVICPQRPTQNKEFRSFALLTACIHHIS